MVGGSEVLVQEGKLGTHTGVQRMCIRHTAHSRCSQIIFSTCTHHTQHKHRYTQSTSSTQIHRAQVAHRSHIAPNTCNITPPTDHSQHMHISYLPHTVSHLALTLHMHTPAPESHRCPCLHSLRDHLPQPLVCALPSKHTWNCTPRTRSPQCRSSFWQDPCPFLPLGTGNLETDVTGSRERQGSWATNCS